MELIEARALSVGYGAKVVLGNVELEVRPGELTLLIGPNASGKSTLLKTLAGVLKPVMGAVYVSGSELHGLSPRERAKKVSAVFTGRPNLGAMTVEEVVAMGRYPWTNLAHLLSEEDRRAVEGAMKDVGVLQLRRRKVSELSDGQFQRVMIARALAQSPRCLVLDEPTTHLDVRSRLEVMGLLLRLTRTRGIAAIASTHELELALRFADRIVAILDGSIVVRDDPEDLLREEAFLRGFGLNGELTISPATLSVEFRRGSSQGSPRVFVIAGAGTGSRVFRALTRRGVRVLTGVLHRNDVDHHVAASMGIEVISEEPFHPISEASYSAALSTALGSDAVVYASPPIGPLNRRNVDLAKELVRAGRRVLVMPGVSSGLVRGAEEVEGVGRLIEELVGAGDRVKWAEARSG
ncbi:MAG: ABC transporter ATP-binding protein [Thaumarchaeota archaeon]|nr:ABC transporter ATP-binding protein [Candidatus Calditenuaceae archaeon]MDW8041505.1 ABC transporter ATP-binding protein [Nitrososphaerota archaeon]MDW8043122.1 ABC transporter ATP-binding protein [Nitrososphaerota archaeon]